MASNEPPTPGTEESSSHENYLDLHTRLAAVRFQTFQTMFEPEPNPMFGVQVQQITEPEPEQRFRFSVCVNLNIVFQTEHFLGIPSQNFRDFFE